MKPLHLALLIFPFLLSVRAAHGEGELSTDGTGAGSSFFQKGQTQFSVGAGYGNFNNNGYFVAALGGGYYPLDGLEVGLDGETWLGSEPQIYDVSPQVRYILPQINGWRPYIGSFYRRTFYNREFDNINSAGGRAGLVFPLGRKTYLAAGAVYEHYFKCDTAVYSSCDIVYPELAIAFSY